MRDLKPASFNHNPKPPTKNWPELANSVAGSPRCSNVPTLIGARIRDFRSRTEVHLKSLGSREFNQDVSQAKRFAIHEPVFVTDRGKPTHVLLSIESYRQLVGKSDTLVQLLEASEPIVAEPDWRSAGPWAKRT